MRAKIRARLLQDGTRTFCTLMRTFESKLSNFSTNVGMQPREICMLLL